MKKGIFVVVEGADGAGTTTIVQHLVKRLQQRAKTIKDPFTDAWGVLQTCEPSKGPIGSLIREMLKGNIPSPESWRSMAHLFMADRIHHVEGAIIPSLHMGQHVICDRYYPSTLVYQSSDCANTAYAHYRMRSLFMEMNGSFCADCDRAEMEDLFIQPDLFLYLDVDPKVALKRRIDRGSLVEKYEALETQEKVVRLYRLWFGGFPGAKEKVDANQSQADVESQCWEHVKKMLDEREEDDA